MLRTTSVGTGLAGSPYYTTLYWAGTDQADADDAVLAHQAYLVRCQNFQNQGLSSQVNPEVQSVNPTNGDVINTFITATQTPTAGVSSTASIPRANQILVQLRTGVYVGGRQVRGRSFIPGIAAVAVDQATGRVDSSARTAIANGMQTILTSLPALVWSRKNGVAYSVTQVTVGTEFAILRSRRD